MKYYLHLFLPGKHGGTPETYFYTNDDENFTFRDLIEIIAKTKREINPSYVKVQSSLNGKPIANLNMYVSSFINNQGDVYFYCDLPKPVVVQQALEEQQQKIFYDPITAYKFYEYDDWVYKVILELDKVHTIPKEKIQARFLEKGFEIKIHDYKGKNWVFAVPRTEVRIDPDGCKYIVKPDKILISLKKKKKDSHFFTLHKTKKIGLAAGGDDSD